MQLLQTGVTFNFPTGATTLQFIDWPPCIGIDNLNFQLTDPPPSVPEPGTLLLLAGALGGAGVFTRIRRQAQG